MTIMRTNMRLFGSAIRDLLTPLSYLRVRHRQKRIYDFFLPLIITAIFWATLYFLPQPVKIVGDGGLLAIFTGLLQILTGFYIASLAAVATFDRPSMDEKMAGKPPTLSVTVRGVKDDEILTRRRFLSFLFGYLSFLSFLLYLAGAFADLLADNIKAIVSPPSLDFAVWTCIFIYIFLVSHLVVTTFLGLHFMTERIHREYS